MKLVETKINNMLLLDPGKLFFFCLCVIFVPIFWRGDNIVLDKRMLPLPSCGRRTNKHTSENNPK